MYLKRNLDMSSACTAVSSVKAYLLQWKRFNFAPEAGSEQWSA